MVKQSKRELTYPIILHHEEIGYSVEIPDINGAWTEALTKQEALEKAKDLIGTTLINQPKRPKPTPLDDIIFSSKNGDFKTTVTVDLTYYQQLMSGRDANESNASTN